MTKNNMMKNFYLVVFYFILPLSVLAQPGVPSAVAVNQPLSWGYQTKSAADSCGAYFNNYVGLGKTSLLRIERMRTGNAIDDSEYNGRAQKFSAPQPIEVSGIEFYSFIDNNSSVDSLMVITTLNNYDATVNTLGLELARDTVYVTHNSFNPMFDPVPSISVQSTFDTPVVVSNDYMVAIYTPTDDSLRIIANEYTVNDGAGEGLGYALYDNSTYPTYTGWYDMLIDFTADYDFLISPRITYKKPTNFILSDSVLCPDSNPVCLTYDILPIQSVKQYNQNFSTPQNNMSIIWNDGSIDNDTVFACHSYTDPGTYAINLLDTIKIWDYNASNCLVDISKNVIVEDSIEISFTYTQSNLDVDFTTITTNVDSVWWDFGDNTPGSSDFNPNHNYPGPGTYNVWLYSFNNCMTKALFKTITIQPNAVSDYDISEFTFYPNPANQHITISGTNENSAVTIYNIAGKTVYSNKNLKDKSKIDISNLTNGTYFVRLQSNNNTITKKLSIKH